MENEYGMIATREGTWKYSLSGKPLGKDGFKMDTSKEEPVRWAMEEKKSAYLDCMDAIKKLQTYVDVINRLDTYSPKDLAKVALEIRYCDKHIVDRFIIEN